MKKCPSCEKTYEDSMRFCQVDGTPLVDDAPSVDPFKTMVARSEDMAEADPQPQAPPQASGFEPSPPPPQVQIASEPPRAAEPTPPPASFEPPPVSAPVSTPAIGEPEEVLDLPGASDPLKTMYISDEEMRRALGETADPKEPPPPMLDLPPEPPNFIASGTPAQRGSSVESVSDNSNRPSAEEERSPAAAFDATNPPIPSPFDAGPSVSVEPAAPSEPEPPGFIEPETMMQPFPPASPFSEPQQPAATNEPEPERYADPAFTPQAEQPEFKEPEPFQPSVSPSFQQEEQSPAAWTPPPAPDAAWQNQEIGQNTPFQPPAVGVGGQNKTLAIVSLITGILSFLCCSSVFVVGIAAIVTGFMAKNKADAAPAEYGGKGMALAGMILGGISVVFGVLYWVLVAAGFVKIPGL